MASPQLEHGYMRIANEIWEQIMMRDFTKRQRAILDLILRLSWGCQKKTARVRNQSDFELVGVGRTHVKRELEWLEAANVIRWYRTGNEHVFEFNKNHDEWKVSIVRGYDEDRLLDLVAINLHGVTETVTDDYQNGNSDIGQGYQNSNRGVTKTVTPTPSKPAVDAGFQAPKDNIKDNISISLSSEPGPDVVMDAYHTHVGLIGPTEFAKLQFYEDEGMAPDVIVEAIVEFGRKRKEDPRTPFSYLDSILRNWLNADVRNMKQLQEYRQPKRRVRGDPAAGHMSALEEARKRWEEKEVAAP